MRYFSILAFTTLCAPAAFAEQVVFEGAIGPYQIEAELMDTDDGVTGRYRYSGRDSWLDLTGEVFGQDAIKITETAAGETTGTFYLEVIGGSLEGFWAHNETDYPATLTPVHGALEDLLEPVPSEEVSEGLTGRYYVGGHWVNDWFAPNYEIGFNGGDANVVRLTPDQILVRFEFVVGPTYHFAFFQGVAKRVQDNTFVHDAILEGGDRPCRLVFQFDETGLVIDDTGNGFACQFGARAHANFDLTKVSDTAEFDGGW